MRISSATAIALSLLFALSNLGCIDDEAETGDIAALASSGTGNVSLEWSIYEGDTLRACADAAAAEIAVVFSVEDLEVSESIDCGPGTGETSDVPSGEYDVTVTLVDREGGEVARIALGAHFIEADRTTPLGHVDLVVDAK